MADKRFDLVFNASLEIGQVKTAINQLNKSLEGAGAKIPQSMSTNLTKMIQTLNTELNKIEGMADIKLEPKNAKDITKSYEKIFTTFQQLKTVLGDIYRTAGIDPEKFFPTEIAQNITKATQAVAKYKKTMEAGVKTDEYTKASKDISEAEKKLKNLQDKQDEAGRRRQAAAIAKSNLESTRKNLQNAKDKAEEEHKAAQEAQKDIQERIKAQEKLAQIEENLAKKKKKQQTAADKAAKAREIKIERENAKQSKGKGIDTKIYRDAVASYQESTAEVQKLQTEINQLESEYNQLSQSATVSADEITAANKRASDAAEELVTAQKRLNKNQVDIDTQDTKYTAATADVKTLVPEIQKAQQLLDDLIQKRQDMNTAFEQKSFETLIQELEQLGVKLPDAARDTDDIEKALDELASKAKGEVVNALQSIEKAAEDVEEPLRQVGEKEKEFDNLANGAKRAEQDMENLKNQVLDFFSIGNTIQIFKNAIRDAFNTVKELDAAMTETAVVTDFSIGDMWDKLPEYAVEANKLGTSIKSLYEATTLYYQQGLNSQQAMDVGVETMKMARIAGMDAVEATEAMTAALRGFNMEINEASATRINDVYSELAAITASDTEQIATAMSKTASIASSANMEFETTAALLAQIIETTQEAPETAGTAMKTIIARFTEVKQLFSEGMLTGEDSEGESIDINKIDAALKSVGISLKDFLNGTKGIDDIFLELASKWDTLDLATQRYIATMAAGSRQQSRFIAMMSNYDRTMELVNAANNSAGASQKQFGKTLDSLDAKLQRLKNAWDTFIMGLANNEVIKLGVDLLTRFLETINKITGVAGTDGLGGLITMLLRLGTVIGALKGGKTIFESLLKTLTKKGLKINFLDVEKLKGVKDLFKSIKRTGNDLKGVVQILKDPALRGESFKLLGESIKTAGKSGKGLLSILSKFGPYAAIIAIMATATIAFVKSFKAAQKEAKLEKVSEQIEKLSTEAEEASNQLNEITDARSNLEELTETFYGLSKGTKEWKKTLVDINQQVLGLIEKYPLLKEGNYLIRGASGELQINEAGWDAIYNKQLEFVTNLNAQKLDYQSQSDDLKAGIEYDNFLVDFSQDFVKKYTELNKKEIASKQKELNRINKKIESLYLNSNVDMSYYEEDQARAAQLNSEIDQLRNQSKHLEGIPQAVEQSIKFSDWNKELSKNPLANLAARTYATPSYAYAFSEEYRKYYDNRDKFSTERYGLGVQGLLGFGDADMQKLFDYFAEVPIANTLDGVIEQVEDALGEGYDKNYIQSLAEKIEGDQNFQLQLGREIEAKDAQKNLLREFAMNAISDTDIIEKNHANSIVNAVASSTDKSLSELINEKEAELKDVSDEKIADMYAEKMGYVSVNGEVYTDSTFSTKIDTSAAAMRRAVATTQAEADMEILAQKYDEFLQGQSKEFQELFGALFSENGAMLTQEQINPLLSQEINENTILGDTGKSLKDIADSLGIDVVQFVDTIAKNVKAAEQRLFNQRKDIVKKAFKYDKSESKTYEGHATNLALLEEVYGNEIINSLSNVFGSLEKSGNEDLARMVSMDYYNALDNGLYTPEEATQVAELLSNINWSNSVDAMAALREEAKLGTGMTKEYAKALLDVNHSYFDLGNQTQDLFGSESFGEIQTELDKILETNEEISASDVNKLADSYKILDNYLENTEMTASGLAKALTLVSKGTLSIDDLTTSVMSALSSFNSLEDMVANVLDELENLDLGMDENQVAGKTKEYAEIANANIQKGAYGNTQTDRIFDYYFGNDWDKDADGNQLTGNALINRQKEKAKFLTDNSENYLSAWTDLINKGYSAEGEPHLEFDPSGGIRIANIGDMTSKELSAWMQEAYGITENLAEAMIADLSNYSTDMRPTLEENDFKDGIEKAVANAKTIINGKENAIFDQKEIDAMVAATGRTEQEIINAIRTELGGQDPIITEFFDKEGVLKEGEDLFAALTEAAKKAGKGKLGEDFFKAFVKKNYKTKAGSGSVSDYFDYEGFRTEAISLGLNTDQATQAANQAVNQAIADLGQGESIIIPVELDTGEVVDMTAYAGDTIEELKEKATLTEEANAMADALVQAIKEAYGEIGQIELNIGEQASQELEEITTDKDVNVTAVPITGPAWTALGELTKGKTVNVTPNLTKSKLAITGEDGTKYLTFTMAALAKGIKNAPHSMPALTGEEGPELVQTENGAYLVGQNGPEMANIQKGDTVYTADETKKILKGNTHTLMPRYNDGKQDYVSGYRDVANKGSGGKIAGKTDENVWENPYDKFYNLVREIAEELRQRERIERRYEKLLEEIGTTGKKLFDNSIEELKHLQKERILNEKLREGRRDQIKAYQAENEALGIYAKIVQNERGEDVLRINWDLIDQVKNTDEGEKIEDYVSQLEEWMDGLEEIEDALWDIEDQTKEIMERGKDEYLEFEEMVKEALIASYQEEIDKLDEINQSISDTNAELLEAMSAQIDKIRQDRENEKIEQELSEKQRRLAYLQQDTSGANALEILELQKEIDEETEDYTDSLIDQKISELEEQNNKAAEQREQQTQILQAQLDWLLSTGEIWKQVEVLIAEGIDINGELVVDSELMNLLKAEAEFQAMSAEQQKKWLEEIENISSLAYVWKQEKAINDENLDEIIKEATKDYFADAPDTVSKEAATPSASGGSGGGGGGWPVGGEDSTDDSAPTTGMYTLEEIKNSRSLTKALQTHAVAGGMNISIDGIWGPQTQAAYDAGWRPDGKQVTLPNTQPTQSIKPSENKNTTSAYTYKYSIPGTGFSGEFKSAAQAQAAANKILNQKTLADITTASFKKGKDNRWKYELKDRSGKILASSSYSYATQKLAEVAAIQKKNQWKNIPTTLYSAGYRASFTQYKTGGLADFTGPAWLDGTKSRPEMVLNARDTQNFIQLKDILGSLLSRTSSSNTSTENNGDITYDIDINVETIGSDYDIEQVANKIKSLINEDARYRNNNAISLKR